MLSSKVIGLPVIHIDHATRLGSVREVILDPRNKAVTGLVIGLTSGWFKKGIITMDNICALGQEALMISNDQHIYTSSEDTDLWELWRKHLDIKGMPLLTTAGEGIGTVWDYDFNLGGNISSLIIYRGFWSKVFGKKKSISGLAIHSFGDDAVILQNNWQIHILPDDDPQIANETENSWKKRLKSTFNRTKKTDYDDEDEEDSDDID
jgi:uncharacterized protein YrrD